MIDQRFCHESSLAYRLKAAERQLEAFRSGKAYTDLRNGYTAIIRDKDRTINQLQHERDDADIRCRENTKKWMEVLEDMQHEHEKEMRKQKKLISELMDIIADMRIERDKTDSEMAALLSENKEAAAKLDEVYGIILKLKAQVNRNYENSSLPSSKCIGRKKIVNNREKTGKKPGGQPGHPHHPRKPLPADETVTIEPEERFLHDSRYVPTGNTVTRQVIGVVTVPVVIDYCTPEFYDKQKGRTVHSEFPAGVNDDVNYAGTLKGLAFLLNNRCNVSLEKTSELISSLTGGALTLSVGMINKLCREFSEKSTAEQDEIFKKLLDAPSQHIDFTQVRVNGKTTQIFVGTNAGAAIYLAREQKGHEGIKGTTAEHYGGTLIHDHDKTFYSYGSDHQECMVHILRGLKDSMQNEPGLQWNGEMHSLIRKMIHAVNQTETGVLTAPEIESYSQRYDAIVEKARKEYEEKPPSPYYPDGYNLYERMVEYKHNHLLFLSEPYVESDNNLAERHARIVKGKVNQAISLRSFEHLSDYCDCLSVMETIRKKEGSDLYNEVVSVFDRPKPVRNQKEKSDEIVSVST